MRINRRRNIGPGSPNYIPARSSQNGGQRACLCPEENTYSRECCDGSIWAQGIGSITRITWKYKIKFKPRYINNYEIYRNVKSN